MFTVCAGLLREGSGVNLVGSTALGTVDTIEGCSWARSTKFSRLDQSMLVTEGVSLYSISVRTKCLIHKSRGRYQIV